MRASRARARARALFPDPRRQLRVRRVRRYPVRVTRHSVYQMISPPRATIRR